MQWKFYTYLHRRADTNEVFYIGKGHGRRAFNAGPARRNSHWSAIMRKHGRIVEICARWPTEDEALSHEVFLIDTFRKLGHRLVNCTDGGEGGSGAVRSADTRERMSLSLRAVWQGPSRRLNGKMALTEENRQRMAQASKASWADEETRSRRIESLRRTSSTPEAKARRSAASREAMACKSARAAASAAAKAAWSDPATRERILAAQKAARERRAIERTRPPAPP